MTDQVVEPDAGVSRRTVVLEACLVAGAVTLSGCTVYDTTLETPATTKPGGSGIGLVLCRQIAEVHGGTLSLANRPEGGCRATLRLDAVRGKGGQPS